MAMPGTGGFRSAAITYRERAVADLERRTGVYALCDLDQMPIYIGQSVDGIQNRVRRHLTSARSDIIANRQVDVWEIAWVMAWPASPAIIPALEAALYHHCNARSPLMNGSVPILPADPPPRVAPEQIVQVMSDEEIARRLQASARLPRQIEHYGRLVDHYLNVKSSAELRMSMEAHFDRLARYHHGFLEQAGSAPRGSEDARD
ncbi:GIY-YIG nuclease family protein [Sphingomonas bacterium]|uniref:GIY-YIG nuclease family protein n=1 Tax=Sphingomonas bacterium TaxID=1895847 RepID=UPI001C2D98CC|nr:GIY-YIG nuclease family protein [Sphingomonas bacterium]